MTSQIDYRPLNVALRPQSRALRAYTSRAQVSSAAMANGFHPAQTSTSPIAEVGR